MDNKSMKLTNTEQPACGCGLAEATEMKTNAAGGSVATRGVTVFVFVPTIAVQVSQFGLRIHTTNMSE